MNSKQNDLFSFLTPARLARVYFLPIYPCRGTAAHFLAFTLQFNLTQVCLATASSLCWALGTLRQRKWLCPQELIV